jgi:hypothetical protein
LATHPNAHRLAAIRKLIYLAVAHDADRTSHTGHPYSGSSLTDLAVWTGLPIAALTPALAVLSQRGWLDGNPTDGYRPAAAAFTFAEAATAHGRHTYRPGETVAVPAKISNSKPSPTRRT